MKTFLIGIRVFILMWRITPKDEEVKSEKKIINYGKYSHKRVYV